MFSVSQVLNPERGHGMNRTYMCYVIMFSVFILRFSFAILVGEEKDFLRQLFHFLVISLTQWNVQPW